MVDADDFNTGRFLDDSVDNPVSAPPRSHVSSQFAYERFAYSMGILEEWSHHEFDDGRGHLLWESDEAAFCGWGDHQPPAGHLSG
jgi:hypothetical protein